MTTTQIPIRPNILRMKKFWTNKSSAEDKGGSFNMNLYLAYLSAIENQQIKHNEEVHSK